MIAQGIVADNQQLISLGIGGLLISLVGYSVWKLIGGWMTFAGIERTASKESKEKADHLQSKLSEEISKRVALEVEVHYLKREIEELKKRIIHLESDEDNEGE